jgi:hypothetical protein
MAGLVHGWVARYHPTNPLRGDYRTDGDVRVNRVRGSSGTWRKLEKVKRKPRGFPDRARSVVDRLTQPQSPTPAGPSSDSLSNGAGRGRHGTETILWGEFVVKVVVDLTVFWGLWPWPARAPDFIGCRSGTSEEVARMPAAGTADWPDTNARQRSSEFWAGCQRTKPPDPATTNPLCA